MFTTKIVKEIRNYGTGQIFTEGNYVRILLKSTSEYIGTITNIFGDSFSLLVDGEEKIIELDSIDKMRIAETDETFYNHFNF